MKNPMTPTEMKQAIDDNAAGHDMQFRTIGDKEWRDRPEHMIGKALDLFHYEYRRKPELIELWVNAHQHVVTFSSKKYEDAVAYGQYYSGGTIHKMVEDTNWVEPEPEEKNPWQPIVPGEWPECKPTDEIHIRCTDGMIIMREAANVVWTCNRFAKWRYAEDE